MNKLHGLAAGLAVLGSAAAWSAPASAQGTWSGLYFGGHLGGQWTDIDWTNKGPSTFYSPVGQGFSSSPSGGAYGVQAGLQHQWGNIVAGVEVDFTGSADTVRTGRSVYFPNSDTWRSQLHDTATVTGRLGYAVANWLLYVKGGYANADIEVKNITNNGLTWGVAKRHGGYTLGAGLEYKVMRNVSIAIEYDYLNINGGTHTGPYGGVFVNQNYRVDDTQVHEVTARLNFYLHRPEPVVEAMK